MSSVPPGNPALLLSECMGKFKNADFQVYAKFMEAMDQYVFDITVAVTEAAVGDVLVCQGRAQQARKFMKLFTELPQ